MNCSRQIYISATVFLLLVTAGWLLNSSINKNHISPPSTDTYYAQAWHPFHPREYVRIIRIE